MQKYVVIEKQIGETPLSCVEAWREAAPSAYLNVPLAYAGRLDPMASGKLLVLIGEECKVQEKYHGLDKEYEFSILCGVASDTGDVLGQLTPATNVPAITVADLRLAARGLIGTIALPYPHFSSKTVQGKPLHVWTLENRLDEITIPIKHSRIYSLTLLRLETKTKQKIYDEVRTKIEAIPTVTAASKALGNDFRRPLVRESWRQWYASNLGVKPPSWQIATFRCVASSGTYMRSLAEVIAKSVGTVGLAYHIHRTNIGHYQPLISSFGFWRQRF